GLARNELLEVEIGLHHELFHSRKLVFDAEVLFQHYEAEVTHHVPLAERGIARGNIHLLVAHQVFHHLAEKQVDALLHPEAEAEIDAEHVVGGQLGYLILHRVGLVGGIDVDKPIDVRPLGPLLKDGVDDFLLDFARALGRGQKHEVGGVFANRLIIAELLERLDVGLHLHKVGEAALDVVRLQPHVHHAHQGRCDGQRHEAAMRKLNEVGHQKRPLNDA
nr:hypothetical protein [Tanacetum cinerariifolium]